MSITRLPKPKTPAGRAVRRAAHDVNPRTAAGKIAVALTAEIGGALGDTAYRVFGPDVWRSGPAGGGCDGAAAYERSSREERARRYAAEALREQQEAGRRAQEAYRRARANAGARSDAGSGTDARPGYHYAGKTVVDYYEVLEVSPKARPSVIEKAYRALMREDHPDQGGDVAKAQLINEAYQVLRDPVKRAQYDRENRLS